MSEPSAYQTEEWAEDFPLDFGKGTRAHWLHDAKGGIAGLIESHWCVNADGVGHYGAGAVQFIVGDNPNDGHHWTVEQLEPLTLSPSIACASCTHHGWIRDGQWVTA